MVTRDGDAFLIRGPKGRVHVAVSGKSLDLTYCAVHDSGIHDLDPLFDEIWALCPPNVIDEIRFWWRAGDPNEMYVVRKR
jgi:hypothetical protein